MSKLVSFKVAKLAKEKGFKELVVRCYNENETLIETYDLNNIGCEGGLDYNDFYCDYNNCPNYEEYFELILYSAPTQSCLQIWLRDKQNLHVSIQLGYGIPDSWWSYFIQSIKDDSLIVNTENIFYSYEEALEDGLYEALKIIEK